MDDKFGQRKKNNHPKSRPKSHKFLNKILSGKLRKKKTKKKKEKKGTIYGYSLQELLSHDGVPGTVPIVLKLCIDFLREHALEVEGIFRIPGHQIDMEELAQIFYEAEAKALIGGISPAVDVHVVAELLKKILREMPEPLFTFELHQRFIDAISGETSVHEKINKLKDLFMQLPVLNRNTICYLFNLLVLICQRNEKNLMDPTNMSTIFGPTLMRSKEVDLINVLSDKSKDVILLFLEHFSTITKLHEQEIVYPFKVKYNHNSTAASGSIEIKVSEDNSQSSSHSNNQPRRASTGTSSSLHPMNNKKFKLESSSDTVNRKITAVVQRRSNRKMSSNGSVKTDSRTYPKFLPKAQDPALYCKKQRSKGSVVLPSTSSQKKERHLNTATVDSSTLKRASFDKPIHDDTGFTTTLPIPEVGIDSRYTVRSKRASWSSTNDREFTISSLEVPDTFVTDYDGRNTNDNGKFLISSENVRRSRSRRSSADRKKRPNGTLQGEAIFYSSEDYCA
eukprot:TRINITY_DN4576_c0_g1_i2.p1 TRINITY_DN4576_c0_g1~~TRINITY_DN4576_c0_g1_i2.p1  ORF type:complete len:507 (+),score=68.89 TRINITY_DN4576_c0_g1_i2:483-2003(+)